MQLTGPVAGHDRVKTNADPTGRKVFGTINNCAGGVTPWGTYIIGRGEYSRLFRRQTARGPARKPPTTSAWAFPKAPMTGQASTTASISSKEPNEPNRFGWVVEVDVNDPNSDPEEAHGARPLQA